VSCISRGQKLRQGGPAVRDGNPKVLCMKTDVLVIGGGITGCALAYFLASGGARVSLVERHDLNTQASGSNAGSIHAQMDHDIFVDGRERDVQRAAPLVLVLKAGIDCWKKLEQELEADFELETLGGLLVTDQPDYMRVIERKVAFERALGLPAELLSESDLRRVAPYISDAMVGGELCPIEGEANALVVAPALAAAASRHGAEILIKTEVRALSKGNRGFVAETSNGRIEADRVVNCAGAEAAAVGRLIGVELPIFGEPIQVNVTEPTAPLVRHLVYYAGDRLTLKQSKRGALIVGGGWPAQYDAAGRLTLRPESLKGNLRVCRHVVPKTASVRVIRTWPAVVNGTADDLPIIDELSQFPGYFLASFPSRGFTGGPVTGRIVANMLLGKPQEVDISPFSLRRFN
jgi:sarcosine oxidase subunit beta